jgi:hypothetical protein
MTWMHVPRLKGFLSKAGAFDLNDLLTLGRFINWLIVGMNFHVKLN